MDESEMLRVFVDEDATRWAKRFWDTYGFDYDTERAAHGALYVWPLDDMDALKAALDEDGVRYQSIHVNVNNFFGLEEAHG